MAERLALLAARGWGGWQSSKIAAVLLIAAFAVQTILASRTMSATDDEPTYIAAGYAYWKQHDDRFNKEHPPLVKLAIAFPLLFLNLKAPEGQRGEGEGGFARAFLYQDWTAVDSILFRARLPVVFLGVVLAVFVKRWTEELWGPIAGLGALLLLAFEPNVVANSSLATLDTGLTTFTFLSAYCMWKWLETGTPLHKVAASVMLGFALLSKFSALAFLPILYAQLLVHGRLRKPRNAAPGSGKTVGFLQILLGSVLVVVAVYTLAFNWHVALPGGAGHQTVKKVLARVPWMNSPRVQERLIAIGERLPIPAVDHYLAGAIAQRKHVAEGQLAFFMGHYAQHGWWYYDLAAFLMKTPIPIFCLAVVRLFAFRRFPPTVEEYFVMLPVVGILALSSLNTVSIGLRYVLPLYPFLFVWLGRVIALGVCGRAAHARPTVPPSVTWSV